MTETDILSIRNDLTEIVISVVSVSIAMISGHIAGLWLYLKGAPRHWRRDENRSSDCRHGP